MNTYSVETTNRMFMIKNNQLLILIYDKLTMLVEENNEVHTGNQYWT